MKKTICINVGGYSFNIEEDAFERLRTYTEEVEKSYSDDPNCREIVSDIEYRIGELLCEMKGQRDVIEDAMVTSVIARIGDPAQLGREEKENIGDSSAKTEKPLRKKLYRDIENSNISGVCAGFAQYFGIETAFIRLAVALLCLGTCWLFDGGFSFGVVLVYLICWLCIPAARTTEQRCEMKGAPMKLEEYRYYSPVPARSRSKAGSTLRTILGLSALFAGGVITIACTVLPFCKKFFVCNSNVRFEMFENSDLSTGQMDALWNGLIMNHTVWWIM